LTPGTNAGGCGGNVPAAFAVMYLWIESSINPVELQVTISISPMSCLFC
jgi:hypothetical protein